LVVVAIATIGAWLTIACGGKTTSDASRLAATTTAGDFTDGPVTLPKAHDITFDPCTLVTRAEAEAIVNATVSAAPVRGGRDDCLMGGGPPTAMSLLTWRVVIDPSARARIKALENTPSAKAVAVSGIGQEAVWALNALIAAAGGYRIEVGVSLDNRGDQAESERLALVVISHLPPR
jgi:hypothetical protein